MKVGLVAVAGLAGMTAAAAVLADEARVARVALLLPACEQPGLTSSELRSALSLDLRDEGFVLAPLGEVAPGDVLVRLQAACSADAELTLEVALQNETRTRHIDLSELPPTQRARALSLSLAELLSQLARAPREAVAESPPAPVAAPPSSEPAASVKPPSKPAVEVAKPPSKAAPDASAEPASPRKRRESPSRAHAIWQLSLAPELRFFQTSSFWGARALGYYGAWSAGLDFLNAQQAALPGTVSTLLVHASCAYGFRVLGDPAGSLLEAGPRLGAGRTFMNAEANATGHASSAQDVYLDAAFAARYSFRLSAAFRVGLAAELGYARGPIGYADNLEVARTAGGFASLMVDGALRL